MIYQGTTPTIEIEISRLPVSNITSLSLAFSGRVTIIKGLSDVTLDTEANKVIYTLTEAETMALASPIVYQLRAEDNAGMVWATDRFTEGMTTAVDKGLISNG